MQTAFTINKNLVAFLENFEKLGFSDQSEVVCVALERLKDEIDYSEAENTTLPSSQLQLFEKTADEQVSK